LSGALHGTGVISKCRETRNDPHAQDQTMACQNRIDARLIAMQQVIESAEKKRDAAVERWTSAFGDIAKQIGRLEGKLGTWNNGKQ